MVVTAFCPLLKTNTKKKKNNKIVLKNNIVFFGAVLRSLSAVRVCVLLLGCARSWLRGGSVPAFSSGWCLLALVPSWQDVARCRTRSGRGKAIKNGLPCGLPFLAF